MQAQSGRLVMSHLPNFYFLYLSIGWELRKCFHFIAIISFPFDLFLMSLFTLGK